MKLMKNIWRGLERFFVSYVVNKMLGGFQTHIIRFPYQGGEAIGPHTLCAGNIITKAIISGVQNSRKDIRFRLLDGLNTEIINFAIVGHGIISDKEII